MFLNTKSIPESETVASLPKSTYVDGIEWFVLDTISSPEYNTALNKVDETWHTPPPIPYATLPLLITCASLYPFSALLTPVCLL